MQSILEPTTCGYDKIKAYNIFNQGLKGQSIHEKLVEFTTFFNNQQVDVDKFKRFKKIKDSMRQLGKTNNERKMEVLEFFSESKWNAMTNEEKQKHRIFKCPGCKSDFFYRTRLAMFNQSLIPTLAKLRQTVC